MSAGRGHMSYGVDLGGTHLRVVRFHGLWKARERPGSSLKEPVDATSLVGDEKRDEIGRDRGPEVLADRISVLLHELARPDPAPDGIPVGIGVAGLFGDREGLIARSPHLDWTDVPLGRLLEERLASRFRLQVVNDVHAATWGEFRLGAGQGSQHVLTVFVGTGVGGGFVSEGVLVEGATGCAGEIGHTKVVLGEGARRCRCGGLGCLDVHAGGRGVEERVREELSRGAESAVTDWVDDLDELTVVELDRAAASGDPYADSLWDEVAGLLALSLANAVTLLNPRRLVLGGGVLSRAEELRRRVLERMEGMVPPPILAPLEIREAALGDLSGALGAALLAEERGRGVPSGEEEA